MPQTGIAAQGAFFITLSLWTGALLCRIHAAPPPDITETFVTRSDMNIATMRPAVAASDSGFLLCWTT